MNFGELDIAYPTVSKHRPKRTFNYSIAFDSTDDLFATLGAINASNPLIVANLALAMNWGR
jgi:hypothetical protein